MNISWRENIHLELTVELKQQLDGSPLRTNGRDRAPLFESIDVDLAQHAENLTEPIPEDLAEEIPGETADPEDPEEQLEEDPAAHAMPFARRLEKVYSSEQYAVEIRDRTTRGSHGNDSDEIVSFALLDAERIYHLPATRQADGSYLISISITTFRNRQEIIDGKWALLPVVGEVLGPPARFDLGIYKQLPDFSRVFMHSGNREAYTITFALTENERRPEIRIRSFAFSRIGRVTRKKRAKQRFRKILLAVRRMMLQLIYTIFRVTRPGRRTPTILFASEQRNRLQGNLEAVNDRMVERGLDREFRILYHFWVATNRDIKTRLVQTMRIARADYLVIDDFFPGLDSLKLRESTQIIQAWHAGVGFKAVGYARYGNAGSPPRENSHRRYTWAIAGSKGLRQTYADVFGIEPEAIVPTGLPRIDGFLAEEQRESALAAFQEAHPEVAGRKLVLFAPTYRGRGIRDAHYDYRRIDFAGLYEYCGEDTVIGFRMHHFIKGEVPIPEEYADRFIDLSHYPDGLGLLHSTDVLITDYSSIIYEYALLDRPILFYAYDRDAYAATRGFQQDYDSSAPGKVCQSFDELLTALRTGDFEQEKVTLFRERNFDAIDTHSSDRFIDWFFLGKMPEEF